MTTKTDSVAMKEAIEEIEKMIDSYKNPKSSYSEREREEDENFRRFSQFVGDMVAQGMERALEALKKRVI